MISLTENITYLSKKYTSKITKLIQPLNQHGITYFVMQKVTANGHWSFICNHPLVIEYSADAQLYKSDPTLVDPEHYESGIQYLNTHQDKNFQEKFIIDIEDKFRLANPLAIVDKNSSDCEFFFFVSSYENKKIINTYISKINLLRRFINYIKQEQSYLFQEAENYKVDLKTIKKDAYFNQEKKLEIVSFCEDKYSFSAILSKREKECVFYFLNGKTAKETAIKLGISYRTVEDYFIKIKKKFGCKNKRELYAILNNHKY